MEYATKALNFILSQIQAGKTVYIQSYTKTVAVSPKTFTKWAESGRDLFKATNDGLRMSQGKEYVLITNTTQSLCRISAR